MKSQKARVSILVIIVFILVPKPGFTAIFLDGQTELVVLGHELKILEDKSGNLTINDLVYSKTDADFVRSEYDIPNFGHTRSVYWVRLDLYASSEVQDTKWILELANQLVFWVDLYMVDPNDPCINSKSCLFKGRSRDVQFF